MVLPIGIRDIKCYPCLYGMGDIQFYPCLFVHPAFGFHSITEVSLRPKKKICVFPIAWSSKLGSIGRDFVVVFFVETYKYAPSSKITQACLFLSYYSLLIIWHAVQCFCYHLCVFSILYFYCWSRKQTRKWKRRRISGFCRSIIFFCHKKCWGQAIIIQ